MKKAQMKEGLGFFIVLAGLWGYGELQAQDRPERPKNVILMIGDGMGLSQLSSTYYFMEEDEEPAFSRFKLI